MIVSSQPKSNPKVRIIKSFLCWWKKWRVQPLSIPPYPLFLHLWHGCNRYGPIYYFTNTEIHKAQYQNGLTLKSSVYMYWCPLHNMLNRWFKEIFDIWAIFSLHSCAFQAIFSTWIYMLPRTSSYLISYVNPLWLRDYYYSLSSFHAYFVHSNRKLSGMDIRDREWSIHQITYCQRCAWPQ